MASTMNVPMPSARKIMSDMSGLLLMSGADVTGEGSQISIGKAALRHKEKIKTETADIGELGHWR